jgi:hypothetical protein
MPGQSHVCDRSRSQGERIQDGKLFLSCRRCKQRNENHKFLYMSLRGTRDHVPFRSRLDLEDKVPLLWGQMLGAEGFVSI